MAADVFNARLAQANLVSKTNFDNTVSSLDSKITKNKTKNLLVENQLNKLKTIDSDILLAREISKKMAPKII